LSAWKEESLDAKGKFEARRLEEVRLEELERHHRLAETLYKEGKFRMFEVLGMKDGRIFMGGVFMAWSHFTQLVRESWTQKLNRNEAMNKYSLFLLGQKLKRDDISLATVCLSEWHRDANKEFHQRLHKRALQTSEEDRDCIAQLLRKQMDLAEQLTENYEQIDRITMTLQKELKTKEELAAKLRIAYSKMRTVQMKAAAAARQHDRHHAEFRGISPTSIDQTLDPDRSLTHDSSRAGATQQQPLLGTVHRRSAVSCSLQVLPLSPNMTLARQRAVYSGDPQGVALYGDEEETPTSHCDWDQAVRRMGEEGLMRMDSHRS